jgi:hypothetical protein
MDSIALLRKQIVEITTGTLGPTPTLGGEEMNYVDGTLWG